MPIGNLTSQLFANVYLNEFDRFVRHTLKPLGYVRYGDDFVLYAPTRERAIAFGAACTDFLARELFLSVHPDNNVVVKVRHGLHFLGHHIYPDSYSVDPGLVRKIERNLTPSTAASYSAQALPRRVRKQFPWLLIDGKDELSV